MESAVFSYLSDGDATILERKPLECLTEDGQLNAFKHYGFWRAMDTLKEKTDLTALWTAGKAPWALWLNNDNA
jgi:glucose-1-phosphate cytidylyltransferase